MDRNQLLTIALTALISVTAKEFVTWLLGMARFHAAKETTKTAARKVFSKDNLRVIWTLEFFCFSIWLLVKEIRSPSPLTKSEVVWVALGVINLVLSGCYFAFVLLYRIFEPIALKWAVRDMEKRFEQEKAPHRPNESYTRERTISAKQTPGIYLPEALRPAFEINLSGTSRTRNLLDFCGKRYTISAAK